MDAVYAGRRGDAHARFANAPAASGPFAQGRHSLQHPIRPWPPVIHRSQFDRTARPHGSVVRAGTIRADVFVPVIAVPASRLGFAILFPRKHSRTGFGASQPESWMVCALSSEFASRCHTAVAVGA